MGPINQVYFTIKPQEGIVASSFKTGDKVYIGGDKLLPLEKYVQSFTNSLTTVRKLTSKLGSFPSPSLRLVLPSPNALEAVPVVASVVVEVAVVPLVGAVVSEAVVVLLVAGEASVVAAAVVEAVVVSHVVVAVVALVAASVAGEAMFDRLYCLLTAFGGFGSSFQDIDFRVHSDPLATIATFPSAGL